MKQIEKINHFSVCEQFLFTLDKLNITSDRDESPNYVGTDVLFSSLIETTPLKDTHDYSYLY